MTNEPTQPLPESLVIALGTASVDIELLHLEGEWSSPALLEIFQKHLAAPIQELLRYKRALENHLCEYERANWLGCNMDHNGDYCDVCESDPEEHQHKKITKLIVAAESRGRDAGLEEAALTIKQSKVLLVNQLVDGAEIIYQFDRFIEALVAKLGALKTSAPEVKS